MAEAILSRLLARRAVPAEIASAGLLGGGRPMPSEALDALATLSDSGPDMSAHRSRTLTARDVERADLVLGMTREHVREAVVLEPAAWSWTFTLKELVRRGEAVGSRAEGQALRNWLAAVSEGRDRRGLLGTASADYVADPMGGTPSMFEQTATEIEELCRRLIGLLWG
jgi:protein-tyrosine phosphatase